MADFNDLFDDEQGFVPEEETDDYGQTYEEPAQQEPQYSEEDLIGNLLKRQGIQDPDRIKFEGDDGIVKERSWDDLSYEEQLNILSSDNSSNPETDLDDNEIDIINAIRSSKLTPSEYIDAIKNQAINEYQQQNQGVAPQPRYTVDDYTDDELFLYDMQARMPDITDDELTEALESAKQNESVYKKQVNGIRNEYKQLENNKIQQEQMIAQQQQQEQYNRYANEIINAIDSQGDIAGTFELENEDKQMLAYAILGQDQAGISNLGKALNDPQTLVKMMWFALKGEEAIDSINEYYKDQISKARQKEKKKGLQDAKNGNSGSRVVTKPKQANKVYKTVDDLY